MKRIISAVLCAALLFTAAAFAEVQDMQDGNSLFDKLETLGIMWDTADSEYDFDKSVTRGEFATFINRFAQNTYGDLSKTADVTDKESFLYKSVQAAVEQKLMRIYDDGSFAPDMPIKADEAGYSMLKILGYSALAELSGGYPKGYREKAEELGLFKGVSCSGDSFIKGSELLKIIDNFIDTNIMTMKYNGTGIEYVEDENTNILEKKMDIYKFKGRITANEYGSILGEDGAGLGKVIIDGKQMDEGESNAGLFLGYKAEGYYRDDDGEYTVLWLLPDRKDEIFVYAKDIEKYANRTFEYTDKNLKYKKVKISQQVKVIYNGVALPSFTDDVFMPKTGDVTLLKSTNGSEYDVAIITSYENYVVESINFDDCILYGYLDKTFKWDKSADVKIYSANFNEMTKDDISKGAVLSIAKSRDSKLVTIMVNSGKISGKIESISVEDGELIAYINGKKYFFDEYYNKKHDNLEIGSEGDFYTDIDGKIAYYRQSAFGKWIAGYIIKGYIDEEADSYVLRIFDGEVREYKAAKSVKIDAIAFKTTENIEANCQKEKFVLFKLNSSGEVTAIDYASNGVPGGKEDKYSLREMDEITAKTWFLPSINTFRYKFILSADTKVFVIPEDKNDYAGYMLTNSSYFKNNTYAGVKAFCVGDDAESAQYVLYEREKDPSEIKSDGAYWLVSKIVQEVGENDEIVNRIYYWNQSGVMESAEIGEDVDVSGVAAGDLIQPALVDGALKDFNLSFDYSDKKLGEGTSTQYITALYTYAYKKVGNTLYLGNGSNAVDDVYKLNVVPAVCPVYIYDTAKNRLETGSVADIIDYKRNPSEYTRFLIRITSDIPNMIIIWE